MDLSSRGEERMPVEERARMPVEEACTLLHHQPHLVGLSLPDTEEEEGV